MAKRGVQIFSSEGLHAKVFVFGSIAFIGSANVSGNSEKNLVEAVVATRQRAVVASARQFVRENCHKSLGPEEIDRLRKIYREPVWKGQRARQTDKQVQSAMRIVRLVSYDPPEGLNEVSEKAERSARKKIRDTKTHTLYEFHWRYDHSFSVSDLILPISNDGDGKVFACPPGTIVTLTRWKRGSKSKAIVFLEVPKHRRIRLQELAKRIGRIAGRKLKNARIIRDQHLANLILDMFPSPTIR